MHWDTHEVSAKAAIYDETGTKALVMIYAGGKAYGLPGGHLDAGETPIQAMKRELAEEVSPEADFNLVQQEFFIRNDNETPPRLILGYSGCIAEDTHFVLESYDNDEHPVWVTREEIKDLQTLAPGYLIFALKHWPKI
ncbi:MAG: NUDIX hydrolase [Candidatus Saccharimonas sp.]